jgi:hypothetical protein
MTRLSAAQLAFDRVRDVLPEEAADNLQAAEFTETFLAQLMPREICLREYLEAGLPISGILTVQAESFRGLQLLWMGLSQRATPGLQSVSVD